MELVLLQDVNDHITVNILKFREKLTHLEESYTYQEKKNEDRDKINQECTDHRDYEWVDYRIVDDLQNQVDTVKQAIEVLEGVKLILQPDELGNISLERCHQHRIKCVEKQRIEVINISVLPESIKLLEEVKLSFKNTFVGNK
jgi:hypothetical protein